MLPPIKEYLIGFVSVAESWSRIFVQPVGIADALSLLEEEMLAETEIGFQPLSEDILELGQACAAQWEGVWYRARIQSVANFENLVDLLFVDYGNEQSQLVADLRELPDKFLVGRPPMALKCNVRNAPENGKPKDLLEAGCEKELCFKLLKYTSQDAADIELPDDCVSQIAAKTKNCTEDQCDTEIVNPCQQGAVENAVEERNEDVDAESCNLPPASVPQICEIVAGTGKVNGECDLIPSHTGNEFGSYDDDNNDAVDDEVEPLYDVTAQISKLPSTPLIQKGYLQGTVVEFDDVVSKRFYVQTVEQSMKLGSLQSNLLTAAVSEAGPLQSPLRLGEACAVFWNSGWHRAEVRSSDNEQHCLMLIDAAKG